MMNAVTLRGFGTVDNFAIEEHAIPVPAADEALVRIHAAAFNPIDYQMRRGSTESKLLKSPILGRECSGSIVEIGSAVAGFRVGDRVAAYVGSLASNGTYAEYIAVPHELLAIVPPELSYEEAAALPMVGLTALQVARRLRVPADAPVLVTGGAGGVGTILIKLLRSRGYENIVSTAGSTSSEQHLIELGIRPENIVNYRNSDICTSLAARTSTGSFTHIIDLVGGAMSEICATLLDVYGTYADVTSLTTAGARETLFDKAATIVNIANYAHALTRGTDRLAYYGDSLAELFGLIGAGVIRPAAVHVLGDLSVATVQEAHRMLERNETGGRKLVMRVG